MGSPFFALIRRKPPNNANNVPLRSAGERNLRPFVEVGAQDAPDPIRQGDTPSRAAQMPIVFYKFDEPYQTDFFGEQPDLVVQYARRDMRGSQTAFSPRTNIGVPPHVAYGSLFTAAATPYELG